MNKWVLNGALGLAMAAAVSGSSNADATYTINIVGYVPVVCRVTADNALIQDGQAVQLNEFCNNATGYQVWADTAPGATGTISVDGNAVELSASGSTMIDASSTSAAVTKSMTFSGDGQLTSLSLRVVPI